MTRKDFELIARVIREIRDIPFCLADNERDLLYEISHKFADELQHTNANFDRDRFLRACGTKP